MNKRGKCKPGYEWCIAPHHIGDREIPKEMFGVNNSRKDNMQLACKPCTRKHGSDEKKSNNVVNRFKKYPTPQNYIYSIFNKLTNEIVYIGKATIGPKRMYQHLSGIKTTAKQFWKIGKKEILFKEEIFDFWYNILEDSKDLSIQKEREKYYRKKLKPILNPL